MNFFSNDENDFLFKCRCSHGAKVLCDIHCCIVDWLDGDERANTLPANGLAHAAAHVLVACRCRSSKRAQCIDTNRWLV